MPRLPLHALVWSSDHARYELYEHGQLVQNFRSEDGEAWSSWLDAHTSFAFYGSSGRLNVHKEARSRGQRYWYAYHKTAISNLKRYLGRTASVTLARLEEVARIITTAHPQAAQTKYAQEAPTSLSHEPYNGGIPIVRTKLSPPRLSGSLVGRERLLRELNETLSYRLTLLSAPAGSGKTTLLAAWAGVTSPRPAWLSLDALDNDSTCFWASVIAALRHSSASLSQIGEIARAMLHSPQPPPLSTFVTALINEIAGYNQEILLIVDDYHVISDQAVHESMLFWLDHLPDNLHLIISSRIEPDFPLSRLRAGGQMIELRATDLRFTRAETTSFLLQVMGLPLSEENVATLEKRTEGWIAGLQLAALAMRKREDMGTFVKNFAGNHRFLLDYVQQEILTPLPAPLQEFLLHTSILTRMNASVCQAVTTLPSQQMSQEILEELERANLFVVPLDEQRQWYRFHDLFRDALLARLQGSQPELISPLHQRAARWYETQGWYREAITHALAAKDYPLAAFLVEQAAEQFWLSGESSKVHDWMLMLPDTVLRTHARLALNAALRLLNSVHNTKLELLSKVYAQVERLIARMDNILLRQQELALSDAEVALIGRRLRLLRALIEATGIFFHRNLKSMEYLSQEIEKLPQDEEMIWNLIPLSFTFWLDFSLRTEGAHLIQRLLSARQQAIRTGDYLAIIRIMLWLAFAYRVAGKLRLAHQQALEGLALIEQIGVRTFMTGYLYMTLFDVYYARNQLDKAADILSRLERIGRDWQQMDLLNHADLFRVSLLIATGDLTTVLQILQRMEAQMEVGGDEQLITTILAVSRTRWWLAQGNLVEASKWAAQTTFHPDTWNPLHKWEFLLLIRVHLANQQYTQAVEELERFSQQLDRPGDVTATIEFLIVQMIALHYAGRREQVRTVAARLFALTEPEGFIRVYLDEGESMRQVLQTLLDSPQDKGSAPSIPRSYVSQLLAAFEQDKQTYSMSRKGEGAEAAPDYYEALSPQEMRVLGLLVTGQTYAEMAQTLFVSHNTIKTQVSSIYRKLWVSRRAEAIAQARHLRLLSS